MTQPAFDVPAGERREPSAAERFAGRTAAVDEPAPEVDAEPRVVALRAVLDVVSMVLIFAGAVVGTTAAWTAGGRVPGMATLAGCLIGLGLLLALND